MAIKRADGVLVCVYAIGNIEAFLNGQDPNTLYPGTRWERVKGRVVVGVDESQAEFNTVNKFGGHKYMQAHSHTGSTNSAGSHTHGFRTPYDWATLFNTSGNFVQGSNTYTSAYPYGSSTPSAISIREGGSHSHTVNINSAGSGNSQNLQPYVTKYLWERIA